LSPNLLVAANEVSLLFLPPGFLTQGQRAGFEVGEVYQPGFKIAKPSCIGSGRSCINMPGHTNIQIQLPQLLAKNFARSNENPM